MIGMQYNGPWEYVYYHSLCMCVWLVADNVLWHVIINKTVRGLSD